jgi:uncharacterized membrane protein HdeD (DUF308 family)
MKSEINRIALWSVMIAVGSILVLIGIWFISNEITRQFYGSNPWKYAYEFYEALFCLDGPFLYVGVIMIILGAVKLRKNTDTKAEKGNWASK